MWFELDWEVLKGKLVHFPLQSVLGGNGYVQTSLTTVNVYPKALFGCAHIHLNPHVLVWIGVKD